MTSALLEMARDIAIQDHHNPLSQHGIACYVTKFESKSHAREPLYLCFIDLEAAYDLVIMTRFKGHSFGKYCSVLACMVEC